MDHLYSLSRRVGLLLSKRAQSVFCAESCTGGMLMSALIQVPGASRWVKGGMVPYTSALKQQWLGVSPDTIDAYGIVSEPVVVEMAQGGLACSDADIAIAVSGYAGSIAQDPQDSDQVGRVCFGFAYRHGSHACDTQQFFSGRQHIRHQACCFALSWLLAQDEEELLAR